MNLSPGLLQNATPQSNTNATRYAERSADGFFQTVPSAQGAAPRPALLGGATARWLAVVGLATLGWLASAALHQAHAQPLVWSVGVQAPGAVVHVSNLPPPRVVVLPPVHTRPPPVVVYAYPPVIHPRRDMGRGHGHGHGRRHWKEQHGHWQGQPSYGGGYGHQSYPSYPSYRGNHGHPGDQSRQPDGHHRR